MVYFEPIHVVSTDWLEEEIERMRVIYEKDIYQCSNALFITVMTLKHSENRHNLLWIYYSILRWTLSYTDYTNKDLPPNVVEQYAVLLRQYFADMDNNKFIIAVHDLNGVVGL